MPYRRIIVTGGAGFVGSNLALKLKSLFPTSEVIALDNLYRKGSEKIISRLENNNIIFLKADVRDRDAILNLPSFDLMIECSAEPSVQAGYHETPFYLLDTNLGGVINCVEACRQSSAQLVFISTSRVYPIEALRNIPLVESKTRLDISPEKSGVGWSSQGISLDFPLNGPRSLYGSSKLSGELLLQEYHHTYGLPVHIVRSGAIAGPWQMGKTDQGFVSLWCAAHMKKENLNYIGFGGSGKQVRDVLHIEDFCCYIETILKNDYAFSAQPQIIGGGCNATTSLSELSAICEEYSGHALQYSPIEETHPSDIPYFVVDNLEVTNSLGWAPVKTVEDTVRDIFEWLKQYPEFLT